MKYFRFPCLVLIGVFLLIAGLPQPLKAADIEIEANPEHLGLPIAQILVSGNEKSQTRYVIKWSRLEAGQILTVELLTQARQALRDIRLFKSIEFGTRVDAETGLVLTIVLSEKIFSLVLPRINRNTEGDIKTGVRMRLHNLHGADHTLTMLVQQEDEKRTGDKTDSFSIKYDWPLFRKPYELEFDAEKSVENNEVQDFDNRVYDDYFLLAVSRDWHLAAFEIPLTLETALIYQNKSLERPFPESLNQAEAGIFNRVRVRLEYDDVHSEPYRRFGSYYAISVEQGLEELGSDYESTITKFELNGFRRLNAYDNINYRTVLAMSNNSPFDVERYGIGGSSNLRGLENVDDNGDARFFTNIDYVYGLRSYPKIALTLFVDFGNVYDDLRRVDLTDLRYTLGTGFRWKIESFVDTDLFIDYGYDVEGKEGKIYGGTSLAF